MGVGGGGGGWGVGVRSFPSFIWNDKGIGRKCSINSASTFFMY